MNSERGISLILALFSLVVGLWGLLTFAWLPLVHRNARLELQVLADAACGGVSIDNSPGAINQIPFQRQMWEAFRGKFQNPNLKYVRVIEAKLFLATPPAPEEPTSLFSPAPGGRSGISSFETSIETSNGVCFRGENSTILQTDFEVQDCGVGEPLSSILPANAANNIRNFGNTTVCSLIGEVRTELFGISLDFLEMGRERRLHVVSGFWAPVRGVNSSPPLPTPNGQLPLNISNSPGMFLAIAPQIPQMDDAPFADRFKFPNGNDLKAAIENTDCTDQTLTGLKLSFCKNAKELTRTLPYATLPSVSKPPLNSLIQRRYGCLNPLIQVRNMFVSALLSFSARHGQLRNMTEVALVNSRVFDRNYIFESYPISPTPAYPVRIKARGEDLLDDDYSIPYAFLSFPDRNGGTLSFSPIGDRQNGLERHVTSQLPHCAHFYSTLPANHRNFLDRTLITANSEFDNFGSFFDGNSGQQSLNLDSWFWERDAGGFSGSNNTNNMNNPNNTPRRRLPHLMMMLGGFRMCPFFGFSGTICESATALGNRRAFPDLIGLFNYLTGREDLTGRGKIYSKDSVGIDEGIDNESDPRSPEIRMDDNFPLGVVIMHDVPPNLENLEELIFNFSSPIIGEERRNSRPLHFVIIPSREIDTTALEALKYALRGRSGARRFLNSLTVIEPCERIGNLLGDGSGALGARRYPDFCDEGENGYRIGAWGDVENLWRSFWLALAGEAVQNVGGTVSLPEADTAYGRALEFFRTRVTRASSFF